MLLGASGLLGHTLRLQSTGHELIAFERRDLDIRDAKAVASAIRDARPDWVLNATAYTDVDGAERDRATALAVNATAVGELAHLCRASDAGLMHFSTDYVFPGDRESCYSENDVESPVNAYGASKQLGEQLVRESGARHVIVRTQWLFGTGGRSFLSTVWQRAVARQPIRVVADEFGLCTYVSDLAAVSWQMLGRTDGTYHVANRGRVSRYDVARRIYAAAGAGELVTAVQSADIAVTARRPTSSMLCVDKIEQMLGRPMPVWTDAVDRYLLSLNVNA